MVHLSEQSDLQVTHVLCWQYPMAAGSAAERAEAGGAARAKKRGREVLKTCSASLT